MPKEEKNLTKNEANADSNAITAINQKLDTLLQLMNPQKPGLSEVSNIWYPPIIRVHQNNSRNPPAHSRPGDLYTDTGDVLQKPFKFYPLYVMQVNMYLEEDAEGNFSVCRSEDGQISNRGIECATCPKAPFKNKDEIQCRKVLEYFVIDEHLTQIYKLAFSKTSYRAGTKLLRQISGTKVPWQRKYLLDVEQNTKNIHKYFVLTASATTDAVPPEYETLLAKICDEITKQRKRALEAIKDDIATVTSQDPEDI